MSQGSEKMAELVALMRQNCDAFVIGYVASDHGTQKMPVMTFASHGNTEMIDRRLKEML